MMKEEIKDLLYSHHILPVSNQNWKNIDIYLCENSTNNEYLSAKRRIQEKIPKRASGIYIISNEEMVLYIGESKCNIRARLERHLDKIFIRQDRRADFFKVEEHQGRLSIYYWSLPQHLIVYRKIIEELMILALEPEYVKWNIQNKMVEIHEALRKNKYSI
ncbi:GIY-YIG nuclease family protein [Gracilibacillus xinjiangensis]|uniref:GIY-YIG nuclease family protein n=1 Tax=Gracilibacillus xinjiangensis TaxID=1193282 RepID=A0ABV8WT45_9BACI